MKESENALKDPGTGAKRWFVRLFSRLRSGVDSPDGVGKLSTRMADVAVWENWREYLDLVSWLVPDVYRYARARVLGVVLLSVIGVCARAATIGSMILYIKARTSGDPLVMAGITLPTEASVPVFLLWGSIALGFAVLTIAASYRADVLTFDLAQNYMEIAMRRVLRHQAMGRPLDVPEDFEPRSSRPIALMLRSDTLQLFRVVLQTLGILLPLITLIVAIAVLILTNWMLTLFLIPAAAAYSYGLGIVNRGVLRDTQKRQFAQKHLSRDVNAMLRTLDGTRYPAGSEPEWLDSYPDRTWLSEVMGAFRGVILAKKRVAYLGDAFQGVALLMVVLAFGALVADEGTSWAVLLTFLMALGYARGSMGRVSAMVTAANRYVPQLRRYVLFMQMNPDAEPASRDLDRSGVFHFEAREPRLPGSGAILEARPGQVLWCIARGPLTTDELGEVCFALAGGDPAEAVHIESELFFLGGIGLLPERALRSYLPFSERADVGIQKRIDGFLEAMGVREEFEIRLGNLDTVLTREIDEQLSPELRYALRLLPGVVGQPHLVLLNLEPLEMLSEVGRDRVLSTLADRVVMLVSGPQHEAPDRASSAVMVIDGAEIRGVGDASWYATLDWTPPVREQIRPAAEWSESGLLDDEDDED